MSEQISQEMKATGVAQVLVFLKPSADKSASSVRANLEDHFTRSEYSVAASVAASSKSLKASNIPKMRYYRNLGVALGTVSRDGLAALRADDNVEQVSGTPPIRLIRPREVNAASLTTTYTWGIEALGVKELWKEGLSGKDVLVGHLDTGVDGKHLTMKNAIFDFTEFDEIGKELTPKPKARDSGDHGTHGGNYFGSGGWRQICRSRSAGEIG